MTKRKCKKGYSCGNSCQPNTNNCPSKSGADEPVSILSSNYLQLAKISKADNAALIGTSTGDDRYSKQISERAQATREKYPELNEQEVIGIANWVGPNYRYINRELLGLQKEDSEPQPWAKPAASAIQSALSKLPPTTPESLRAQARDEDSAAKIERFLAKGPEEYSIQRGITIGNADEFAASQEYAAGNKLVTDHLFAASYDPDLGTFDGNISYKIKAKLDGTSKGKAMDAVKASRFESELLYPVGAEFNIDSVTDELRELPPISATFSKTGKSQKAYEEAYEAIASTPIGERAGMKLNLPELSKADASKLEKFVNKYTSMVKTLYLTEL